MTEGKTAVCLLPTDEEIVLIMSSDQVNKKDPAI